MAHFEAQWGDGYRVRWRNLTKIEYTRFKRAFDSSRFSEPMAVANELYATVLQDGPDPRYVSAGISAYIAKHELLNNPFSGRYEDIAPAIEMARRVVTGDYLLAASAIISATLNYKPEEIEQWDPNTFFIRLAQAEIANGRTFDPVDPRIKKDAKGNPQKKIKKPLTTAQEKVIARTRDRMD